MRESFKTGVSFGLTSGIITTLGLIVGLHSGTHSKPIVIGGILTIAIADAFLDALGIHVSEESENRHSPREIWESMLATFVAKFLVAATFVAPILLWPFPQAIVASVGWGLALLVVFNYFLARLQGVGPWVVILEHMVIALLVITVTHFVGDRIGSTFTDTPRPA